MWPLFTATIDFPGRGLTCGRIVAKWHTRQV